MILEYERLLSDISPIFASTLHWSCNASSNDAERIAVEETGALLAVYMGEIPIHLANKNTLGDEKLERIALLLESLLLNLEDLVSDDIPLCSTPTTEVAGIFPKLNALHLSIQREPSIDTCAQHLSLHQQPIKFKATRRRISGILEDIKRTTGDRPAESAVQPPMDAPIAPVKFHESFYTSATRIFDAFQHHLKDCESRSSDHKAFLHLKGSLNSGMKDQGDRVDVLLAICTEEEAWQEVRCAFLGCKSLNTPPGESSCIKSICEVARQTYGCAGVVEVHVSEHQIFNMSIEEAGTSYSNADPAIRLSNLIEKDLLANRYTFPERHKLVLAFNLAQSLLQLYCSQWIQKDWTAEELCFLYETDKNKVHNIHQPYICCSFDGRTYKSDIEDSWHRYPFILAFGKLLFEIAEGRSIVVEKSKDGRVNLLRTLHLRFEKRCKDHFSTDYSRAILGCLKFQKLLQELRVGDELTKCRSVIQKEIVEPLGREVARFNNVTPGFQDLDLNGIFSLDTVNNQKQTARPKDLDSLEHECSSFNKAPGFPIRLLQFSDYSEPSLEEKKSLARSFLRRFEEFRAYHVSRSEHAPRVKIAVLDTGLNLDDPSIRALRRGIECSNRSREVNSYRDPIRGIRNFTPDSDADAEGHGTRVAGLLLTVAPEADVYVAKISHKMTTEVSDRTILEAFQWAIGDIGADIVSMSFGFVTDPVWKYDMDQAIASAYRSNKLLFAAASNYGANKRRTYPANETAVFCIHATDGNGNKSGMDPVPLQSNNNFTTLGVAVPCGYTDGKENFLSGSSYSTPIAVGIAANILDQAGVLHRKGVLDDDQLKRLYGYNGMKKVFELMACQTDRYDYLAPWNLWHGAADSNTVWGKIKEELRN